MAGPARRRRREQPLRSSPWTPAGSRSRRRFSKSAAAWHAPDAGGVEPLARAGGRSPCLRCWPPPVGWPFLVEHRPPSLGDLQPVATCGRHTIRFSPHPRSGKDIAAQLRARGLEQRHKDRGDDDCISTTVGDVRARNASFVLSSTSGRQPTTTSRKPFMSRLQSAHFDYAFDYRPSASTGPTRLILDLRTHLRPLRRRQRPASAFTPGHTYGHMSLICRLKDRDLVDRGRRDLHPRPARSTRRASTPEDRTRGDALEQGLQEALQAPVPAGRDHPRARPGGLGLARRPLRVARASLQLAARSSWRPAA